jgi:hypothetical protein
MTSTGNQGLDALADAIAERVFQRLTAAQEHSDALASSQSCRNAPASRTFDF